MAQRNYLQIYNFILISFIYGCIIEYNVQAGQVAQLVEQWTENPRVGGSIPPLATILPSIIILSRPKHFGFVLLFFNLALIAKLIKCPLLIAN
jgi:hypothetical protein